MTSLILPPKDLLPTSSQQWGRWVTDSVQKVARSQSVSDSNADQRNATLTATIARLRTQVGALQTTNAQLLTTQGQLQQSLNYQASLTTTSASPAGTYNTGDIPGDSTTRWTAGGIDSKITTNVPTGRLLVAYGCGQVTVQAGNGGVIAYLRVTATAPSGWSMSLGTATRVFVQSGMFLGVPVASERTFEGVPTGEPITVGVEFGHWSNSSGPTSNAQFATPYIRAQVVPA